MKNAPISWSSKLVDIKLIKPTPTNYKIKNAIGRERLQTSLKAFGIAGNVVCNTDYTLIDGNSRLEEEKANGTKKLWVSLPSRKLTPKEYVEMSALFDFAKAGEVDMDRIQGDLGSSKDFFNKWGLEVPLSLLEKLGSKANITELEYPEEGRKDKNGKAIAGQVSDIKMVQLFFDEKQEAEFRVMEEKGKKKFKVDNTTEFVFKALKSLKL